ncbi:hypothetical protein SK128_013099 [Halocaridina rubra]|uniref:Uncharacterized protein n=1 Tax=Halocaridina rubra TaxID=373956 RepID=A0AAN9AGS9_HALRR
MLLFLTGRYAEVDNRSTDITLTVVEILEKVIIYAQTLLDAQTHEENVLTNEDEPLSHRSDKDKSFIDTALFVLESGVPPGMSQYLEHILASNMRLFQSDSLNQPKDPQPQGETINGNTCDLGKRIQDALNTLAPMVSSGPQCRYDTSRLAKETGLSSPINISNPVKSFKCQNEPSITCYMSRTKDIRMKLMHWAQLLQTNCLPHLEKTFPMLYLHVSDIVHIVNQI